MTKTPRQKRAFCKFRLHGVLGLLTHLTQDNQLDSFEVLKIHRMRKLLQEILDKPTWDAFTKIVEERDAKAKLR